MTMTEDAPVAVGAQRPVDDMTDAEKREAARVMARLHPEMTGAELGRHFEMKAPWGLDQKNIALHGTRRGRPATTEAAAPPELGPPAPAGDAPRKLNGTAHPAPAPPVRPAKPARPKPTPVPPEPAAATAKALVAVTVVAVAVVAVVTMVTSYSHTHDLAIKAGQNDLLSMILPAAVDGLVIAGSTSLLVDRNRGRQGSVLAWLAVALGLSSSMAANVVAVDPTLVDLRAVRWVMAAYAPLALAISGHLLLRMLDQPTKDGT